MAAANGQSFKPTGGKQYEAGVRYQPPGSNMLLSAAVYELTQTDVLKYDAGNDVYRQAGQVRSKGLELEAKADIGHGAGLTRSTIASEIGQRSEDTPLHRAALWLDCSFAGLGLPQLTTGAGARYKGSTQPSGMARAMPAYAVLDAMLSYRLSRHWQLTANVSNLGNKQFTYCELPSAAMAMSARPPPPCPTSGKRRHARRDAAVAPLCGLLLALFLAIAGITGSLLAWNEELEAAASL